MKRRSFIKSSLFISSVVSLKPSWIVNDKVKFGYYYPTNQAPSSLMGLPLILKEADILSVMESVFNFELSDVLSQLQQGKVAGLFISTNILASILPILHLLSDGPDVPLSISSWATEKQQLWDKCLAFYNIKRVPFINLGSRQGLWVTNEVTSPNNLRESFAYGDGLWKELFKHFGAKIVSKEDIASTSLDFVMASNIVAAQEIQVAHNYNLLTSPTLFGANSSQSSFDLYVNLDFWNSLAESQKNYIVKYFNSIRPNLDLVFQKETFQISEKLNLANRTYPVLESGFAELFDTSLFRNIRLQKSGLENSFHSELAESLTHEFPIVYHKS